MLSTSHDRFLFFCAHYITIRSFATRRCYRSYRDRHSPFARNLQAAFWLSCAHYIIIFSFSLLHSRTRAYALFRPASHDRFLFFCAHYITIRSFATRRCYRSYRDRHSPFARNLQAAFWLSCAHYIIIFSFSLLHSRTRAYALFRPASHDRLFVNGA